MVSRLAETREAKWLPQIVREGWLALMSDDVVFLTPGQGPFGKQAFATASRS